MIGHFDPILVLLSYAIAFLGSYMTIAGCEQLRQLYLFDKTPPVATLMPWFLLIGIALGGVGIWCMHFVGMSEMTLIDDNGDRVPISYNMGVSLFSLLLAVVAVIAGVVIASHDRVFAKTKVEILEMLVNDFQLLSFQAIRKMTQIQFLWLVVITDLKYLVGGGLVAAVGIIVMNYLGMAAMEFEGEIHWNFGLVALSVIIALFAAIAAFWILFRLLSIYPQWESLRIVSALVMAMAVCGMHYCGLLAADFHLTPGKLTHLSWRNYSVPAHATLNPTFFVAMAVLWLLNMAIFADLHSKVDDYRCQLKKALRTNTPVPTAGGRSRVSASSASAVSTGSGNRSLLSRVMRSGASVQPAGESNQRSESVVHSPPETRHIEAVDEEEDEATIGAKSASESRTSEIPPVTSATGTTRSLTFLPHLQTTMMMLDGNIGPVPVTTTTNVITSSSNDDHPSRRHPVEEV